MRVALIAILLFALANASKWRSKRFGGWGNWGSKSSRGVKPVRNLVKSFGSYMKNNKFTVDRAQEAVKNSVKGAEDRVKEAVGRVKDKRTSREDKNVVDTVKRTSTEDNKVVDRVKDKRTT